MRIRPYLIELVLVTVLAVAVGYFGYLGYGLLAPVLVIEPFSGESALQYAEEQMAFGDRTTASEGSRELESWLVDELRALGWDVIIQPFIIHETLEARNIVAVKGNGPSSGPVGIVSTHYDTRMFADQDPDPANHIQPAPGANAGAAGVGVLLELARTLDVLATEHTVCLVFFDAEENGDLLEWDGAMGSAYFIEKLEDDIGRCRSPHFAVYLDLVGSAEHPLYATEASDPILKRAIWQTAEELAFDSSFAVANAVAGVDAQTHFADAGVPALSIAGFDYPHRHTLQDTLDRLDARALERIGRTLKLWLEQGAVR